MTESTLPQKLPLSGWPLWLLASLALVTAAGGANARLALRYERDAVIVHGEWWRLLSGHLVHLNWGHTLLNLAGAAFVALLFGARLRAAGWGLTSLLGAAVIGAGFLYIDIDLLWYVGMSGLLHTFFVAGAVDELFAGERLALWLLIAVAVKLSYEQIVGPLPFTAESAGGPVIVNAHLYGAIGGLAAAMLARAPFFNTLMRAAAHRHQ